MTDMYGPNTVHVAAFIERLRNLTADEARAIVAAARAATRAAARDAAWDAALDAAWDAALDTAYDAARASWDASYDAAWDAAWDAAVALVVRDRISEEHYRVLTAPVAAVLGPLHPEDEVVEGVRTKHVEALIEQLRNLTPKEAEAFAKTVWGIRSTAPYIGNTMSSTEE